MHAGAAQNIFTTGTRLKRFYTPDPAVLSAMLKPLSNKVCGPAKKSCKEKIVGFGSASSVDLKYDAISQTLELNVLWGSYSSGNSKDGSWDTLIEPDTPTSLIEVGVLGTGGNSPPEEITLEGKLAVVGQDEKFRLHPKLEVTLALGGSSPSGECTLNAYFAVPQPFFVDPYQLEDTKLMKSYGINRVTVVEGETDLEAPAWAMSKWGAIVLAELDVEQYLSTFEENRKPMEFTLPLHMRYLSTHSEKKEESVNLPWPTVFWACKAEQWSKMSTNPFDRKMLGYEEYFPEQTMLYHLSPKLLNTTLSRSSLEMPILNTVDSQYIEWGTMGVIAIGFVWVLAKIMLSLLGFGAKKVDRHEKKE
ncbi:hypothetical protein ABW20_dc0109657 [Dactylellina cionopaga]|nr:hypothetical protein ABW20_dc0109657 [Dactylellina cionopaga]